MSRGQLVLRLDRPSLPAAIGEAERRGLACGPSLDERDLRLVGEIGGLIAGLNRAILEAWRAGIDVTLVAHYSDTGGTPPKRCVLTGTMKRLALDVRV